MNDRRGLAWLVLGVGVAIASYSIMAQNPPEAQSIDASADLFSAGRAMKHVEAIAREPHPSGSPESAQVREVILQAIRGLGLEPEVQVPRDAKSPTRNIVVRVAGKGPRDRKAVMLCAHYDSTPGGPGAGDNASGVAAILETLRALKSGPAIDRDLIVLIDDGEEVGLLGATLFVNEHPWARDVSLVLNLDARGNHGPSIMFETSAQNGRLIREFAQASPHPLASSLSMDVYRILPNDTNLTVFKNHGIDGLNFAFTRGLSYYHSRDDTPANLDPRSLQHQGENALAMVRRFGRLDLEDIRREDVVYFSILNRLVVQYPASMAIPLSYAPAGLLVVTLIIGMGRGRVKFLDLIVGVAFWPLTVVAAVFLVGGFWIVLRDICGNLGLPILRFDLAILSTCSAVAAVVCLGLYRWAVKTRSLEAISLGALSWWAALAIVTARYLPGMSYLFLWPSAAALLGLCLAMLMPRRSFLALEASLLGSLPALVILPPLALDGMLGLNLRMTALLMSLIALFLVPILPLLSPVVSARRVV